MENAKNELDILKQLCDDTEKKINGVQNDDSLMIFLDSEYPKMTVNAKKTILKAVKGKKPATKLVGEEKKHLMNQLIASAFINDLNPIDTKSAKFVGFEVLRKRIAQKKNGLKS